MGSIVFKGLESVKTEADYTYVDLHLDLQEKTVMAPGSTRTVKQRDIKVDFDEYAIKNSIINILNTVPGERFLVPEFGANLKKYLFSPVTEDTARAIGNTILDAIQKWEPRVRVENIYVTTYTAGTIITKGASTLGSRKEGSIIAEDEYDVTIVILIPQLKTKTNLLGVISKNGFAESRTIG